MVEAGKDEVNSPEIIKVCFLRKAALGLFSPKSRVVFGGAEVRSHLFAEELAKRNDFKVSFLVEPFQDITDYKGGVTLLPIKPSVKETIDRFVQTRYRGLKDCAEIGRDFPFLRIHKPLSFLGIAALLLCHKLFRLATSLLRGFVGGRSPQARRFYRDLDQDIFCCFGMSTDTAEIIASCKKWGGKSVLFTINVQESSKDLLAGIGFNPLIGVDHETARYILKMVDKIIVQTHAQSGEFLERFGRSAVVIKNPIKLTMPTSIEPNSRKEFVLWIGRADPAWANYKRAELCIEAARRLPEIPFLAIINPTDHERFAELARVAPANLTIIESVPFDKIDDYFRRAAIFLNTSVSEGFPNTFLQAAKYSVPILSLNVDPDGMLTRDQCGKVCGDDLDMLVAELRKMWIEPSYAENFGRQAREYVEREHDAGKCLELLAQELRESAKSSRS